MGLLAFVDKEIVSKYSNFADFESSCHDKYRAMHNRELCDALEGKHYHIREASFFNVHFLNKFMPDIIVMDIRDKPHITEFTDGQIPSDEELENFESNYLIYKGGLDSIKTYKEIFPAVKVIAYTEPLPSEFTSDVLKFYGVDRYIERPEVYDGIEKVMSELEAILK